MKMITPKTEGCGFPMDPLYIIYIYIYIMVSYDVDIVICHIIFT